MMLEFCSGGALDDLILGNRQFLSLTHTSSELEIQKTWSLKRLEAKISLRNETIVGTKFLFTTVILSKICYEKEKKDCNRTSNKNIHKRAIS